MFTGLIQDLGSIDFLGNYRFIITPKGSTNIISDLAIGDSIAVDGVCLTVEEFVPHSFTVTASPETLARSTLGNNRKTSSYVNLETSLKIGSKIGGHFVTGHVDGMGCLAESIATATAWEMTFKSIENRKKWLISRYVVSKGSIAINGVSLTIARCDAKGDWFTVVVIPHTYLSTNLQYLQINQSVNLEGDILSKYVEKFLQKDTEEITLDFLRENGYSSRG